MNITMFGTGYVGLVTGTCFAEMGNTVLCVDIDADKIAALQAGRIPIFEPGLEQVRRQAGPTMFFDGEPACLLGGSTRMYPPYSTRPPGSKP